MKWKLWCVLLPIFIAGCTQQRRQPGLIRVAVENDPSTLDPALAYDTTSISWVRLLYRGLVDYDNNANFVNEIARERKVSPDGKSYWFKLRNDVYFHRDEKTGKSPGRRVVADDFRYSLERILDPATASDGLGLPGFQGIEGAVEFSKELEQLNDSIAKASTDNEQAALQSRKQALRLRGIEVKGDDEITFRLKEPDSTFLNYLALPFAYAIPHETVEKWGKGVSEHPNGTGPFQLEEWVHNGWLHLRKNPEYFHRDLPKAERIEVQMGSSPTLQIMRFEQGQTDIINISDAYPPEFLRLRQDSKWQPYTQHAPMMDIRYLCMNTELEPFTDRRVRQAFNYAINRQRIARFLTGRATLARGVLPPGMPAYDEKLFQYGYDPAKARQLLRDAGYKNKPGSPLLLWYSNEENWYEKAAQSMQQDLKQVGVEISLKAVAYAELKAQAGRRGATHLAIMGWLQDFPDPSNFLDVLFNEKSITEEASQNRSFYSNPEVNQLLDGAKAETNQAKRLDMYKKAEKIIVRDAPFVFLHHTERYIIHQPWIYGYKLHPLWSARYEYVKSEGNAR